MLPAEYMQSAELRKGQIQWGVNWVVSWSTDVGSWA